MADGIIARDTELAAVESFVGCPAGGPRALVLEGEPGIGKSTLWLEGVAAARRRLPHVLAARPAESERSLANAVLADLFAELAPETLAALPTPRRRALEGALLTGGADGQAIDPRALGAAVLSVLSSLASVGPVLLGIDDDQWADGSSLASLAFALRRLRGEPVLLLLARRPPNMAETAERSDSPIRLESTLSGRAVDYARVGPLSVGAIQLLLRRRLGTSLSRPQLVRLHEASGGNPFFALELARALGEAPDPTTPLIVPASLDRLLGERLRGIEGETLKTLLLVAAHGRAPLDLLARLGVHPDSIDRAVAEQLLTSAAGAIRFAHPLLASTVYQRASPAERRAAHLRLAAVVEDPIGRARHLALATATPDEEVAATVESAATLSTLRGMPVAAAALAEHAARLTPGANLDDALRRSLIAARAYLDAGEAARARTMASTLLSDAPPGRWRAEALLLASELEEPGPAVALLQEALRETAAAPDVRAVIHARLGDLGRFVGGRDWAERHAQASLRLAERLRDDRLEVAALSVLALLRFEDADPSALDLARAARRRALALGDPAVVGKATLVVGHQLAWLRQLDEAHNVLEEAVAEAADRDELLRADCLWGLSLVDLWAGRWDIAWERAQEAAAVSRAYGIERPQDHMPQAILALHRGDFALAREHSSRAMSLAEGMMLPTHSAVLAIADLWSGHAEDALPKFETAADLEERRGARGPAFFTGRAEHIEAMLQLGRIDEAERLLVKWDADAVHGKHAWAMAEVVRTKGLVATARGELDEAAALLEGAADGHAAVGDPFGRGRALLALGVVRRRQRQKRGAREAIEAAIALFEALGAARWAAHARSELGRIGGQRRIEGLSPSERRVAELVAEGRTNREIAAALFLGERTVASHLTHAYAKLGVRSRTELAGRLRTEPTKDQMF